MLLSFQQQRHNIQHNTIETETTPWSYTAPARSSSEHIKMMMKSGGGGGALK